MRISDWSSDVCSSDLLVTWSKACAPNTLRAIASDLKIIEAYQAERYQPTLPISPIDLMLLIDDRARSGAAKSSIDRLVASAVRLHKLLELPSPVDENLRWKQKEKNGRGSWREK